MGRLPCAVGPAERQKRVCQQLYPSTARMTQVLEALVVVVLVAISKMLEHHAKKKNFLPPTSFERKIVLLAP
jgi:hypothetical protein